jgi:hypothetical protein
MTESLLPERVVGIDRRQKRAYSKGTWKEPACSRNERRAFRAWCSVSVRCVALALENDRRERGRYGFLF